MIPAHDSPLAALAFDASGTKLATASEKVCLLWLGETWFSGLREPCSFCSHSPSYQQVFYSLVHCKGLPVLASLFENA